MITLPNHPSVSLGVEHLKGVGPQIARVLSGRGFRTVGDLLTLMPLHYQDRRRLVRLGDLQPETEALTGGTVSSVREGVFPKTRRRYFEIVLEDGDHRVSAIWFRLPAHLRRTIQRGRRILVFGRVQAYKHQLSMVHPEVMPWTEEDDEPGGEVRPVYPELEDIRPGTLRRIMADVVKQTAGLPAIFPLPWLEAHRLTDPVACLQTLHRPPADRPGSLPRPQESKAWANLALFELLFLQLALARSRARQARRDGWAVPTGSGLVEAYLAGLPFRLTASQTQALEEIRSDMTASRPMNRLLQGDVGSGKTVLALAAAMAAVDGGQQAALMAPTEILARQHFENLAPHAERLGVTAALLTGGRSEAEKDDCREGLASGRIRLVVGTQALISAGTAFHGLGLVVIDEQHRFGVAQRLALRNKADQADILVMTATPIPRSLAMTLYGDLDVSAIRGLPPGRGPVTTRVFGPDQRPEAYGVLAEDVRAGGQAYVVAPRIQTQEEEAETEDLASAEAVFEYVRTQILPGVSVGLVHGRMKAAEREAVMADFRAGRIRVLTATTVIEVGVDVAGASVMLVEGADRFGLAQLHQLRGRVGRGDRPAQCLLVAGSANGETAGRLEIMARTSDGFVLAEEDLKRRGPGDPLGFKQSGMPPLTWARLPKDLPLLLRARDLAREIIDQDPELDAPEFKLVREGVDRLDQRIRTELGDVG